MGCQADGGQRGLSWSRERLHRSGVGRLREVLQRYRESMQQFALMNHLDVWYYHIDLETILAMLRGMGGAGAKKLEKRVEQGSAKGANVRASKHSRSWPKL